jgi:hypothetical protein
MLARPQFTASLSTIRSRKETRQPKWLCESHGRKRPSVSALTGLPVTSQAKSYEIVNGKLKVLPDREQYHAYWARKAGRDGEG